MDPMDEIRETFFLECEELLESLQADLNQLVDGVGDDETVNSVFRAVHSIKGGAGAFGFEELVRFAHQFENVLDDVRKGNLAADDIALKVFFRAVDLLADLIRHAQEGTDPDRAASDDLLSQLGSLGQTAPDPAVAGAEESGDDASFFVPQGLAMALPEAPEISGYTVTFKPTAALYTAGNEPRLLINLLRELGTITVNCETGGLELPTSAEGFEPEFAWTITVETDAPESDLQEIFEFVEDLCELTITPIHSEPSESEIAEEEESAFGFNVIPLTLESPAEEVSEDDNSLAEVPAPEQSAKPPQEAPAAAAVENQKAPKTATGSKPTVRVDLERVDRLINLVGELVITQAMLSECLETSEIDRASGVETGLDEFRQLTREIQESVMAIRAQPVKSLFQRMARIVREAADATGKEVRLVTVGEATEVDKTVIERLAEPLTHMIRNAVDHGLETVDERVASGKDSTGIVTLSAMHRSGRVVIEIADNGKGINRERVRQIAIDKGLIAEDLELTDSEIDNLLFMAGFSTASAVTDLSGRGVGMDVVKRSIQALGGRIGISSTPGVGSTFSISLPLTLAVLDGMIVRVADQTLVVPLPSIIETLKPSVQDIHEVNSGAVVVRIRDRFVPVLDVGALLGYRAPLTDYSDCVFILAESESGSHTALAVDGIHDQRQVVIKGLEDNYGHVQGVAAATILGDGRIALILDADGLIDHAGPLPSASLDPQLVQEVACA